MTVEIVFQHHHRVRTAGFKRNASSSEPPPHAQPRDFTERAIIVIPTSAPRRFQRFRHVGGRLNHLTATGVSAGDNQRFFAAANACTMTSIFVL